MPPKTDPAGLGTPTGFQTPPGPCVWHPGGTTNLPEASREAGTRWGCIFLATRLKISPAGDGPGTDTSASTSQVPVFTATGSSASLTFNGPRCCAQSCSSAPNLRPRLSLGPRHRARSSERLSAPRSCRERDGTYRICRIVHYSPLCPWRGARAARESKARSEWPPEAAPPPVRLPRRAGTSAPPGSFFAAPGSTATSPTAPRVCSGPTGTTGAAAAGFAARPGPPEHPVRLGGFYLSVKPAVWEPEPAPFSGVLQFGAGSGEQLGKGKLWGKNWPLEGDREVRRRQHRQAAGRRLGPPVSGMGCGW